MKKFKAFTLIETLIVIIVFCIWILAVLHWLTQTLKNKDYANTQIKSAFFAREWIELMFNLRDANYHKKLPWNCIFKHVNDEVLLSSFDEDENPFCNGKFWEDTNNILKVSIWSWDNYVLVVTWSLSSDFEENFNKFQIYLHTWDSVGESWFIYDHIPYSGGETWFARYLVIKWVVASGNAIDKDRLLKIESHVLYKRWYLTWEKVMETFIGNYEFKQ